MSTPPPIEPPFTLESATNEARAAEDARNGRDRGRVCLAYTADSVWRNRAEFVQDIAGMAECKADAPTRKSSE